MEQLILTGEPKFNFIKKEENIYDTSGRKKPINYMRTWEFDLNFSINDKIAYSKIDNIKENIYEIKEREWHKLVGGKKFQSLDKKSRDFLIQTAGSLDFGSSINIKEVYTYSMQDEESK